MKLVARSYIRYKLFNSLFLGLSIGSIFVIYTPLDPSIYSLGGILLALAMMGVAKLYYKILNIAIFYKILLTIELVTLAVVALFLLLEYSYTTALLIYLGYQITFVFGSYLPRAETLFLPKRSLLSLIDVATQKGYLAGMAIAFMFYKTQEYLLDIGEKAVQVYNIHFLLIALQFAIIWLLIRSFKEQK